MESSPLLAHRLRLGAFGFRAGESQQHVPRNAGVVAEVLIAPLTLGIDPCRDSDVMMDAARRDDSVRTMTGSRWRILGHVSFGICDQLVDVHVGSPVGKHRKPIAPRPAGRRSLQGGGAIGPDDAPPPLARQRIPDSGIQDISCR
jgi:hypothetical protein